MTGIWRRTLLPLACAYGTLAVIYFRLDQKSPSTLQAFTTFAVAATVIIALAARLKAQEGGPTDKGLIMFYCYVFTTGIALNIALSFIFKTNLLAIGFPLLAILCASVFLRVAVKQLDFLDVDWIPIVLAAIAVAIFLFFRNISFSQGPIYEVRGQLLEVKSYDNLAALHTEQTREFLTPEKFETVAPYINSLPFVWAPAYHIMEYADGQLVAVAVAPGQLGKDPFIVDFVPLPPDTAILFHGWGSASNGSSR